MSAEDTPDDAAKTRAEERAERELQLKIDTLELEREKFQFTRNQAFFDRAGAAVVRGTGALLFANGTAIVIGLSSYKNLTEIIPPASLYQLIAELWSGFVSAICAFIFALVLSAVPASNRRRERFQAAGILLVCSILILASITFFDKSLVAAFKAVRVP